MRHLETRMARLENRITGLITGLRPRHSFSLEELYQYYWAAYPESFREQAMEPGTFQGMMEHIMNSPIPMKILRRIAFKRLSEEAPQPK